MVLRLDVAELLFNWLALEGVFLISLGADKPVNSKVQSL